MRAAHSLVSRAAKRHIAQLVGKDSEQKLQTELQTAATVPVPSDAKCLKGLVRAHIGMHESETSIPAATWSVLQKKNPASRHVQPLLNSLQTC
jgi:hypothetical protein